MRTATKMSAYGLALALVFGAAWTAGAAIGPSDEPAAAAGHERMARPDKGSSVEAASTKVPGLAAEDNGYRLEPLRTRVVVGDAQPFQFRIVGRDGAPITVFEVEHEKRLHFIVVRRDGSGYQHLHPQMAPDGTWSTPLRLTAAGTYRVFADIKPTGGVATTLGTDIQTSGQYEPVEYPISRTATVDGYEVRLDGVLKPGAGSAVTATVTRNGQPVSDLQPYLGAYGHLVALRAADLGYLHVHPSGTPGDGKTKAGPDIGFAVEVPSAGRYRLFLDFQHEGKARTAEFSLDTEGTPAPAAPTSAADDGHGGHG
ncbi:hypothetical protein [Amycolatopsis sp. NPDC051071]|uniref:hypothetical protein n=1 Tax=Amycolatopsis sp. NPDC051071 TaxID=3154637 RepID=UPI0034301954